MLSEQEFLNLAKKLRHRENLDALLLYMNGAVIKGNVRMGVSTFLPFRYQRVSVSNALPSFRNDAYPVEFEAVEIVYSAAADIGTTFPVTITARSEKDVDKVEARLNTKLNVSHTEKTIAVWCTNTQQPVENN